jgi:AcrR family transcriptional regulator
MGAVTPTRKKGQKTRSAVIAAARKVLLEEGYGNFVYRRVAAAAGVEPGNVQYYFANKRDLLWAVLEPELDNYQQRLENICQAGRSQRDTVVEMVTFLLADVRLEETLNLWLAIWSMAAHDAEIRAITGRFYTQYVKTLSASLQSAAPGLSTRGAEEAAWLITSEFDGLMVVLSMGRPRAEVLEALEGRLVTYLCRMLE